VVRSHYKGKWTKEKIYKAGNSIAAWLGLDSWEDVVIMQAPNTVRRFRLMVQEAK
jgi:hypothetical protein